MNPCAYFFRRRSCRILRPYRSVPLTVNASIALITALKLLLRVLTSGSYTVFSANASFPTRTQKPTAGSAPWRFQHLLVAGDIKDPRGSTFLHSVGLPYGPKPRLFQSYICMKAIKYQSPVVPVERSMSDMMHVLGLAVTGGKYGTIRMFKEQIIRFAACHFTIVGPGPKRKLSPRQSTAD